jgi:hypothetical protein
MFLFDPTNLQFTIERTKKDDQQVVIIRIVGFNNNIEADTFATEILQLHGEPESQTLH